MTSRPDQLTHKTIHALGNDYLFLKHPHMIYIRSPTRSVAGTYTDLGFSGWYTDTETPASFPFQVIEDAKKLLEQP